MRWFSRYTVNSNKSAALPRSRWLEGFLEKRAISKAVEFPSRWRHRFFLLRLPPPRATLPYFIAFCVVCRLERLRQKPFPRCKQLFTLIVNSLSLCFESKLITPTNLLFGKYKLGFGVAVISAENRKRQSVTAKREKSQTPKVLTAILTLPNLT